MVEQNVKPPPPPPLVNSAEGIALLFAWARAHRIALNTYHERIAQRFGVSTDGVVICRPLPTA